MRSQFTLVLAMLALAPVARADVKQRSVTRAVESTVSTPVGLAVDSAGTFHLSSEGVDERLHYTRVDGKHKTDQLVDPDPMLAGNLTAIAVDSVGHPHIAYNVVRGQETVLAYASFDGAAWQIEDLGPQANAITLAIDGDDQPHLAAQIFDAFPSVHFEYIHRDGAGWHHDQPSALSAIQPLSLALDGDGHAHVAAEVPQDLYTWIPLHVTNASGDWVQTDLHDPNAQVTYLGSIALDSLGRPHAVLYTYGPTTLRYSHFDGAQWLSEILSEPNDLPPGIQEYPQSLSIAVDSGDRPSILLMDQLYKNDASLDVVLYAYKSGSEWLALPLAKGAHGHWTSLVTAPDGASIAAYGRLHGGSQTVRVARIAVPDLTGAWSSLTVTPMAGGTWRVDGTLQVTNAGAAKAKGGAIGFYLSSDAVLDAGDVAAKLRKKVGGLAPGASKSVEVSLTIPATPGPLNLIAVVDPSARLDDRDRSNNAIPGSLAK